VGKIRQKPNLCIGVQNFVPFKAVSGTCLILIFCPKYIQIF
jgi:hypothetical protein